MNWKLIAISQFILSLILLVVSIVLLAILLSEEKLDKGVFLKDREYLVENVTPYDFSGNKPFCIELEFVPEFDFFSTPLFIPGEETSEISILGFFWSLPITNEEDDLSIVATQRRILPFRTGGFFNDLDVDLLSIQLKMKSIIKLRMSYTGTDLRVRIIQDKKIVFEKSKPATTPIVKQTFPMVVGSAIVQLEEGPFFLFGYDNESVASPTCIGNYHSLKIWDVANPSKSKKPLADYDFTENPNATVFKSKGSVPNLTLTKSILPKPGEEEELLTSKKKNSAFKSSLSQLKKNLLSKARK